MASKHATNGSVSSIAELPNVSLLTKSELAALLKLTRRGVECLMARRAIPFYRVGRIVRFSYPAVLAALGRFEFRVRI